MTRTDLIVANWKMHLTVSEAVALTDSVLKAVSPLFNLQSTIGTPRGGVEVALCPPFTALAAVAHLLKGQGVMLGAQNCHWQAQGAYTGEVSPVMLKDLGVQYCIVGHSERRQLLQETDLMIRNKALAAASGGLRVILCVGETLDQRKAGKTWPVIQGQLEQDLQGFPEQSPAGSLVVAYEPVWAIGTGQNATGAQAQEVHAQIRSWLAQRFGQPAAQAIRIQYGGSVKPDNAAELLGQPDVDGALVGGASLDPKSFIAIVHAAVRAHKEAGCSTA